MTYEQKILNELMAIEKNVADLARRDRGDVYYQACYRLVRLAIDQIDHAGDMQ